MNHLCDQHPLGGGLWIYSREEFQRIYSLGIDSERDLLTKIFGEYYRTCCLIPVEGKVSVDGKGYLMFDNDPIGQHRIKPQTWKDYVNREKREDLVSFRVKDSRDGEFVEQRIVLNAVRFLKSCLHILLDCESTNKGIGFLNRFTMVQILEPIHRMLEWDEVDFISIAKYITCWPLAASRYTEDKQELPPVPVLFDGEEYDGSPVLWIGAIKRFLMNRILCKPKGDKNLKFLYAWQQTKRGCETVSELFEAEAVKKHQKSLKTPFVETPLDPTCSVWGLREETRYYFEGVYERKERSLIERKCVDGDAQDAALAIVDLLVPYEKKQFRFKELEGSQSACFELMRSEGGQREVVRRIIGSDPFNDYLAAMIYCPRQGVKELRTDLWLGWISVLHALRTVNRHSTFGSEWERKVESSYNRLFKEDSGIDGFIDRKFSEEWLSGSDEIIVNPWDVFWRKEIGKRMEEAIELLDPDLSGEVDDEVFINRALQLNQLPWNNPKYNREKAFAQVATVKEPLKVRTLTKEEAVPQYLCREIQKKLWNSLRNRKPFRLIGEPVSADIIHDVMNTGAPFDIMVSGDYSAATDGLNPRLSELILDRCLRNLRVPDDLGEAAKAILGMHHLSYGERLSELTQLEPFDQVRGQLMGGILSFPILCILNLLTYLVSSNAGKIFLGRMMANWQEDSEYDRESWWVKKFWRKLDGLHVLINGDDILFPAMWEEYESWNRNLSHFGFTKSLGKNLISRRFCTVNSEIFTVSANQGRGSDSEEKETKSRSSPLTVQRCGYLNLGLLEARSKVNQSGSDGSPLWDLYNRMIKDAGNKNLARKFFLTYNKKEIREMTNKGRFNLFLPRSLGGCGFDGEAEFYTEFQLRLASYLYRRHNHAGEVMTEDLGLVNKTVKSCSIAMDTQKGMVGKRIRNFDVPENGWVVKKPEVTASAVLGGAEGEKEMKRRMPYDISPEELQKKPVSIKKLLSFTDCLKIVLQVPRT